MDEATKNSCQALIKQYHFWDASVQLIPHTDCRL